MISVVNGFVCGSSCDVAAAKKGKDPNAPPGAPSGSSSSTDKTSGFDKQPVTILDGALKGLAASAVTAASPTAPAGTSTQPSVNRLA
jgi:hypothetical protein